MKGIRKSTRRYNKKSKIKKTKKNYKKNKKTKKNYKQYIKKNKSYKKKIIYKKRGGYDDNDNIGPADLPDVPLDLLENEYNVIFSLQFKRTNDDSNDNNPSSQDLNNYLDTYPDIIRENVEDMHDIEVIIPPGVEFIGQRRFQFICKSNLTTQEIANLFLLQNLVDGEYGRGQIGEGSFRYPTITPDADEEIEELGVLFFDEVNVNNEIFRALAPAPAPVPAVV